jgi:transcriptional regulator with XRE-family HTH domain
MAPTVGYTLPFASPEALLQSLGSRVRERRIFARLSQADLAGRAGISRDTVVRLEQGGNIGTEPLIRVAIALDAAGELAELFPPRDPRTLDDILAEQRRPKRVRSRKTRG